MPRNIELTDLERQKLADAGRQSIPCTNGWRPIETVPKETGHLVLVSDGGNFPALVHWVNGGWYSYGLEILPEPGKSFTHWQPLPKPPQEEI